MITLPNGKICMNEQEAIQWLLDNYPIPFQCSADYVGGAEIGLGTIVNPTPAKVKVGSIIFFADSKVSTVVAVNSNSFVCSDQYNDLVDDVVYVSNVQQNASGHLIVTLSNGIDIDAGLIKQVSSFSINGSQHLIVTYNDGSTTDLGAIFAGNLNISGDITATGSISAPSIQGTAVTGDSIIENMTGYSFTLETSDADLELEKVFAGVVKTGNKITFVLAVNVTRKTSLAIDRGLGFFDIPSSVADKLFPANIGGYDLLSMGKVQACDSIVSATDILYYARKVANSVRYASSYVELNNLPLNTKCYVRIENTFLLSNGL